MSSIFDYRPKAEPVRREKFVPATGEKLNFSFGASRDIDFAGWGLKVDNSFQTTDDVRRALDRAFASEDPRELRILSRHFFKVSGMYARAARYLAYLPTYDYLITPRVLGSSVEEKNVIREVVEQLRFLEKMKLKQTLPSVSLDVIVEGVYFGYLRRNGSQAVLQKLPVEYCRTGKVVNGFPAVEFNLDYFERFSGSLENRLASELNSFPPEIVAAYNRLQMEKRFGKDLPPRKEAKQKGSFVDGNWILLSSNAIAFYFNANHQPLLSNAFFSILDVMELKGLEKKKAENELFNLVVQQFPLNDDGEPIFDIEEMRAFHDSAKSLFENEDRTDLLTTFGDIRNVDLNESMGQPMDLSGWKKDVYGDFGISPQLFSTEGNMALEKSINADEAVMFTLLEKYKDWFSYQLQVQFEERMRDAKFDLHMTFPPITIMNRKEMASTYKDFATLGYSKFLPAIALGQSQLDILAMAQFENSILEIGNIMDPLRSSHTSSDGGGGKGGRPELPDSEKSEKTIANGGG